MIRNVLAPAGTLSSGSLSPSRFSAQLPIYTDWTQRPDGALVDMVSLDDSGIPINLSLGSGPAPVVDDGALTCDMSTINASHGIYVNVKLGKKVKRIGCTFAFDGTNPGDGSLCLATWNRDEAISDSTTRAQVHFNVLPDRWTYEVLDGPSHFNMIGSGSYPTALPLDGTRLTVEITLEGDTATIYHPNGTVSTVTDPAIESVQGYTACWEWYANTNASVPIKLYETWADAEASRFGQPTLAQTASGAAPTADPTVVHADAPPKAMWPWYRALANRYFAPADVMVIGDSISEGGSATDIEYRWLHRFRDLIRSRFPTPGVTGGQGYISALFVAQTFPHGWVYGGNLGPDNLQGFGLRSARLSNPDGYIARTFTGTGVRIFYAKNPDGGTFNVKVDGGSPTTVDTAAGGVYDAGAHVDIALGAAGSHTVEVTWSGGGANVFIGGMLLMNGDEAAGVRVVDASHWGIKAADYGSDTGAAGFIQQYVNGVKPALTIVALGGNDFFGNIPPADFKADIEYIVSQIKAATTDKPTSILLLSEYRLYATQTYEWSEYRGALKDIAAADPDNVAFVDLYDRWPAGDGVDHLDVLDGDNTHPNNAGHAMLANYVTEFVTPY